MLKAELIGCAHTMEKLALDVDPELALALLGAGGGGTMAYMGTRDPTQKMRNALLGAGAGGLIGYGAGKAIGSGPRPKSTLLDKVRDRMTNAARQEGIQMGREHELRARVSAQDAALEERLMRPPVVAPVTPDAAARAVPAQSAGLAAARALRGQALTNAGIASYRSADAVERARNAAWRSGAGAVPPGAPAVPEAGGTVGPALLGGASGVHPGSEWESLVRGLRRQGAVQG